MMPSDGFQDLVEVVDAFLVLDLGDDARVVPPASSMICARLVHVLGVAHERERDEVDVVLDAEQDVALGPSR